MPPDLPDGLRVFIATPAFGGNVTVAWQLHLVAGESLITVGRNNAVMEFLATDCTHLLFLDADVSFDVQTIKGLLALDQDVALAPYPAKSLNEQKMQDIARSRGRPAQLRDGLHYVLHGKPESIQKAMDAGSCYAEIEAGPTGCMLIKRGVFDIMKAALPDLKCRLSGSSAGRPLRYETYWRFFDTMVSEEGEFLGEDIAFCRRWRGTGGTIWADFGARLGHVGRHAFVGSMLDTLGDPEAAAAPRPAPPPAHAAVAEAHGGPLGAAEAGAAAAAEGAGRAAAAAARRGGPAAPAPGAGARGAAAALGGAAAPSVAAAVARAAVGGALAGALGREAERAGEAPPAPRRAGRRRCDQCGVLAAAGRPGEEEFDGGWFCASCWAGWEAPSAPRAGPTWRAGQQKRSGALAADVAAEGEAGRPRRWRDPRIHQMWGLVESAVTKLDEGIDAAEASMEHVLAQVADGVDDLRDGVVDALGLDEKFKSVSDNTLDEVAPKAGDMVIEDAVHFIPSFKRLDDATPQDLQGASRAACTDTILSFREKIHDFCEDVVEALKEGADMIASALSCLYKVASWILRACREGVQIAVDLLKKVIPDCCEAACLSCAGLGAKLMMWVASVFTKIVDMVEDLIKRALHTFGVPDWICEKVDFNGNASADHATDDDEPVKVKAAKRIKEEQGEDAPTQQAMEGADDAGAQLVI
ncbi:unnamed protein product [Prorocentrum cordatum]|uniref:Nucleotide-diphospho-sugar transferase domain-containing protein n=1 Tax=Prorocentrum cordatum TaxID=2364126 RepID=A0ABN9UCL8_9DINO|nr:unnamed protein product [Polarella glacialis]